VKTSEELDALGVILTKYLGLALLDEDIEGHCEDVGIHAVQLGATGTVAVGELVDGKYATLLSGVFDKGLNEGSPLSGAAPVEVNDVRAGTGDALSATVAAHKVEEVADVGGREPAVESAVAEEVRLGSGGEGEAEEAVVAGVGEDKSRPLGQLGVVRGEVGLAREEGWEVVLAGKREGGGGGHGVFGTRGRHGGLDTDGTSRYER
jgi:hypothetical protein